MGYINEEGAETRFCSSMDFTVMDAVCKSGAGI